MNSTQIKVAADTDHEPGNVLYLACTPLQIINAAEARDRFHTGDNNVLVMVHSPRMWSKKRRHMVELAESMIDQEWSFVWHVRMTRLKQLVFPLLARSLASRVTPCDQIYTGGFQTQQCHLINTIPHRKLTIIDGGACIHSVHDLLPKFSKKRRLHSLIPGLQPMLPDLSNADYFTSYSIPIPADRMILNDYRSLRTRLISQLPVRDEIVFISQPLEHDLGIHISMADIVESAMQHHGVTRCRHILHPRETQTLPYSERLPYLIELFGLREGYLPKAFVTFMSSAARSIQLIYGVPVTCYDIQPLLPVGTPETTRIELDAVYQDFADSGLPVLKYPTHRRAA